MAMLPVTMEEVDAYEQSVGVRLPGIYRNLMLDPKIRIVMSSVGMLKPGFAMHDFAVVTERMRREQPGFPADGVIVFCGGSPELGFNLTWGYAKFLLPQKADPTTLDDVLYSWDLKKRRKARDCRVTELVDSIISVAPSSLVNSLGLRQPEPAERVQRVLEPVDSRLLALLDLRGQAARDAVRDQDERWMACARFEVLGNHLSPCDLGQTPERDGIAVPVGPGTFEALVKVAMSRMGDWPVIATLRITRTGREPDERIAAGELAIDLGAVAIFDRQPFFKAVRHHDRESFGMDLMEITKRPCLVKVAKSRVLILPTGDGDGTYPVYQLREKGGPVGLDIEFEGDHCPVAVSVGGLTATGPR